MSITTRPPATAWIGVTCTDDRLRGLHRRHYSSEKSGRRRGRPVEHPNQLRMIGPGEYLALLTLDASAGFIWRRSRYRNPGCDRRLEPKPEVARVRGELVSPGSG